ncbi:MAG: hypothetical protein ACM3IJ_00310 [Candidatus Levyibacteriota bacterium]
MPKDERRPINTYSHDRYWTDNPVYNGFARQEVFDKTKKVLQSGILQTTLDQAVPGKRLPQKPFRLSHIQAGLDYAILLAETPDRSNRFIAVAPRSKDLSPRLEQEFEDLSTARAKLEEAGVEPFIPKVYSLGAVEPGFSAFTMEYLPNHLELVSGVERSLFHAKGYAIPEFATNTPGTKSDAFTKIQEMRIKNFLVGLGLKYPDAHAFELGKLVEWELPNSDYFKGTLDISAEIIARLYVFNAVTGCVPREFSLAAGDFMIDPDQEDFDPRLITISGGLKGMEKGLFPMWLMAHEEQFAIDDGSGKKEYSFHPFLGPFIKEGLLRGKRLLGK